MKKLLLSLAGLLSLGMVMAQTDLFISEYVEGSGNNKAIEIYNPTANAINLSTYYLARYSNGAATYTAGGLTPLSGTIQPYGTFVIINGQTTSTSTSPACDPALQGILISLGGTVNGMLDGAYPAPTYMNGNDAMALLKKVGANYIPVDLFGQVGLLSAIENETGWAMVKDSVINYRVKVINGTDTTWVDAVSTIANYIVKSNDNTGQHYGPFWMAMSKDHSLKRKSTVISGNTVNPNGFNMKLQWDTVPGGIDVWTELGRHHCIVSDVNKTESLSFELFPNPVSGDQVTFISNGAVKSLEVFNMIGQRVKRVEKYNGNSAVIETSGLEEGLYFVKAKTLNGKEVVKKLVVE